jgi:type II secretion system protein H
MGAKAAATTSPIGLRPRNDAVIRRGFTLLELLLVLAIIGLVAAVASACIGGMRTAQAVDQSAQQVLDQAWRCRRLATTRGLTVRLRVDAANKIATVQVVGSDSSVSDPPDALAAEVRLFDGVDDLTAMFRRDDGVSQTDGIIDVLFRPDARCAPTGLLVLACGERQAAVRYPSGVRPALRETVEARP